MSGPPTIDILALPPWPGPRCAGCQRPICYGACCKGGGHEEAFHDDPNGAGYCRECFAEMFGGPS